MHLNTIIINLISEKTLNSFLYCILLANQYPVTENQINEESRKLLFFFRTIAPFLTMCSGITLSKPMDRF